ncbi:MAG TPA: molybdopterin cofactor-binding domain-containing protein [Thermoanaerobaculia bacterium]|jgi:nicotinate dehydrogenase subunit B|nr:molybdopterin cofactor-binding domain-containing protein [Thermoanaerobaculia bacterium]
MRRRNVDVETDDLHRAALFAVPEAMDTPARQGNGFSRRSFCKLLGGGIVVLITTKPGRLFAQRRAYPEDLNAYLRIDENGGVTLFSGKIEMGQGIHTSLAQMAAEELGVSLDSVSMVMGDTDQCPWDQGTWGSQSTRMFGPAVRAAAAEARTVLMNLAAKKLEVGRDKLVVENGVVSVAGNSARKVTYGELAKGKQIARLVDEKAALRSLKEFKVIGRPTKRMDGHDKVTGRAKYAGDVRRPGMLYARILRPPSHGATRKSLDTSKAKSMSGATVVEKDDLIAVLHTDPQAAGHALALIKADWDQPAAAFDTESVGDYFLANGGAPEVRASHGDVTSVTANVIHSTFRTGYLAHAPMEPHTAIAELKDGKMTVWAGTQSPFGARAVIAKTLGMDEKNVRVITPFVGGGFGGKSSANQAVEAAQLAQIAGKPVMVAWTRGEEFFFDTFGPAAVVKIASAVDDQGKITTWDYHVWAAGDRSAEMFYDTPNVSLKTYIGRGGPKVHPFGTGPWRAPGAGTNVFGRESQIDIMAAAAKIDPLEFRLKNTSDARLRRALKAAADAFGWKAGAGPSGQGRAIAACTDAGAYCALAAEVAVDRATGVITVKRVVAAQDMGVVINPEGAKMQMEGCINMGLGYVLSEELNFKGGAIADKNFDTYELPRFAAVPRIETLLIPNDDLPPQGGGEPAIVPMGAVIANAVFDATGVRMFRLPMTPARVKAAMKT